MRIAASLLMVAAATSIWLVIHPNEPAPVAIAEKKATVTPATDAAAPAIDPGTGDTPEKNSAKADVIIPQSSPSREHLPAQRPRVVEKRDQIAHKALQEESNVTDTRNDAATPPDELPDTTPDVASLDPSHANESGPVRSAHSEPVAAVSAPLNTASRNVTLNYSIQDVAAYLEKNLDDEATDDDKKQSTLKKLLQKANDLKTNQDTFGELRQRKNEILALNFKNDKRGQKTRN